MIVYMKKKLLYLYISFILSVIIYAVHINLDQIKIWVLNRILVKRGILSQNCLWYKISDVLLNDGAGVDLYNLLKEKKGNFPLTKQFDEDIYLVNNVHHIKQILDNSPTIFGVGKLKMSYFKSFMEKNVGVSQGCPWKKRRHINEVALQTDKLHSDSGLYNTYIKEHIQKWNNIDKIEYKDFGVLGKYIASKIIFGVDKVHEDVFNVFSEADTTNSLIDTHFQINETTRSNYLKVYNTYIDNPQPNTLIQLCLTVSNDREEIIHQIPHFVFPIAGLFITSIPRLLIMLCNHRDKLGKVVKEINSNDVYNLPYLRKCIMETVRLINPLITTFRTLLRDYTFDEKYSFKKGTQFLILNNPVLREKEFFEKPNQFIPERWTPEMEKSYYAISFNQGPQRCPGKEMVIFLAQSFVYNFVKLKKIDHNTQIDTIEIDTNNIPQIINPCTIYFTFGSNK